MGEVQKVLSANRISIPRRYAKVLDIEKGDLVMLEIDSSKKILIIIPAKAVPK